MSLSLQIAKAFIASIQPSLISIYANHPTRPEVIFQTGTGYVVRHHNRPLVITAMHTLYGESGAEEPGAKSFFWDGKLHYIDAVQRVIVRVVNYDVAAFFADELVTKPQLSTSMIVWPNTSIPLITIGGYLARDFKRHGTVLKPSPRLHTDLRIRASRGPGHVAFNYTRRKNKNSFSGLRLQAAPRPAGLSGGPMIDSFSLLNGNPRIIGTFTDLENGEGFGANSLVIKSILSSI